MPVSRRNEKAFRRVWLCDYMDHCFVGLRGLPHALRKSTLRFELTSSHEVALCNHGMCS